MSDIVERLRATLLLDQDAIRHLREEAADEIERLRAIEGAAQTAFDYHRLGYGDAADFDANTQIEIMEALGRALAGEQEKVG